MQRQVLFIQGAGEGAHDEWDDKLVESLKRELGEGFAVVYPRMPNEGDPRYAEWQAALVKALDELQDGAVLIGHSIGGAILIHTLAERPSQKRLGAVALVAAPYIGDGGWPSDDIKARSDFGEYLRDAPVLLYHGDRDAIVPFAHLALYANAIPHAVVRALAHRDHQLDNDLTEVARDVRACCDRA